MLVDEQWLDVPRSSIQYRTLAADRGETGVVHGITGQEAQSLEHLQGLRARDCNELQWRMGRKGVTVTMPTG